MAYKFDSDFGETRPMSAISDEDIDLGQEDFNGFDGFGRNNGFYQENSYNNSNWKNNNHENNTYVDAETWKYGEGKYDYLAEDPTYGNDGYEGKDYDPHMPPWFHYFVIDNIKYFIVMFIFYFLFTSKLHSLNYSAGAYDETKGEMLACFFVLTSILFIKSFIRLARMK